METCRSGLTYLLAKEAGCNGLVSSNLTVSACVIISDMLKQFIEFIKEYNVISLAIAFVMGTASTALVQSFVNDIFMPIIAPIFSSESWKTATLDLGPIHMVYGSFLASLINFTIMALVVFIIARKILKIGGVSSEK